MRFASVAQVNERDERLRQQEDELHSNSIELSERNRQLLSIREEQTAQKSSISCLQDKIGEAESEVFSNSYLWSNILRELFLL